MSHHFRQDFHQPLQLLRPEVVVLAVQDHVDDVLVAAGDNQTVNQSNNQLINCQHHCLFYLNDTGIMAHVFVFQKPDCQVLGCLQKPDWVVLHRLHQGCQLVYFHTQNPNLGLFVGLGMEKVVYFMSIWYIL
jgi:hypothetical protein